MYGFFRIFLIVVCWALTGCDASKFRSRTNKERTDAGETSKKTVVAKKTETKTTTKKTTQTLSGSLSLDDATLTIPTLVLESGDVVLTWQPGVSSIKNAADLTYEVFYSDAQNIVDITSARANAIQRVEIQGSTTHTFSGLSLSQPLYFSVFVTDGPTTRAYQMRGVFCGGLGTSVNPYEVCDAGSLQMVAKYLSASYKMTADVSLSTTDSWNSTKGFEPIGLTTPFTGSFDGQGHTISERRDIAN